MTESKNKYNNQVKDNKAEKYYDVAYDYWYNRQRNLRRNKNTSQEKQANFDNAFKVYRKEAVRLKAEVNKGNMNFADFTAWIEKQKDIADKLI